MGKVSGKAVILTGAARGQGATEVTAFGADCAHVAATDVLDDLGQALVISCRKFPASCFSPLHQVATPNTDLPLGEMFDLEPLADDCRAGGVYEFRPAAAPLLVTGAGGAPVTPIAVK